MDDPFDVLGLDQDADEAAVREAYRRRVMEAHPDQGGSTAAFRRVREAYEQLRADGALGEAASRHRDSDFQPAGSGTAATGSAGDGVERGSGVGPRAGPGSNGVGGGTGPSTGDGSRRTVETEVEYLDYAALDANGWSLDDEDLFEKAAAADLDERTFGRFVHRSEDSLLGGAENCGFTWPYSCRGGACANCAVAVLEGDLEMPASHVLHDELLDRGFRLSCVGRPASPDLKVVFDVRSRPELADLLLPDGPFAGEED